MAEVNQIIEEVAPSKIVQNKKDNLPWKTEETRKVMEETEAQLEIAIETKDVEEWRLFRAMRNQAFKFLNIVKSNYYVQRTQRTYGKN